MKNTWREFLEGNRSVDSALMCNVYPHSVLECDGSILLVIRDKGKRKLIVQGSMAELFDGMCDRNDAVICDTNVQNAYKLMQVFEQFRPKSHRGKRASLGLGDRLGRATPGQLLAVGKTGVFPILAQQSMRELGLTGRNYRQVISDACFGVMIAGWQEGYGADGDHLKYRHEIAEALDAGCTMITLDLSAVVKPEYRKLSDDDLQSAFSNAWGADGQSVINRCSQVFVEDRAIQKSKMDTIRIAMVYRNALDFVETIWKEQIVPLNRNIDLEISIDETEMETSPIEHYFVAMELKHRGVDVVSLAPRFPGEFQKAVDYYGDVKELERSLEIHSAISRVFGHKLSVHSGSDKWTAFPLIAKATRGRYHVKTSGTNWLELVKMIAEKKPGLYHKMHKNALGAFDEARKSYHVSAQVDKIPKIERMDDSNLSALFERDDVRQLMHITYGQLLNDKNLRGENLLREEIICAMETYEDTYWEFLSSHIGKHLKMLGEW